MLEKALEGKERGRQVPPLERGWGRILALLLEGSPWLGVRVASASLPLHRVSWQLLADAGKNRYAAASERLDVLLHLGARGEVERVFP